MRLHQSPIPTGQSPNPTETHATHTARDHRLERLWLVGSLIALGSVVGLAIASVRITPPGRETTVAGTVRALLVEPVDPNLPILQLDIRFRALETLRERRAQWLETGIRPTPEPGPVQAGVRLGQQEVELTLGLPGPVQSRGPGELGRLRLDVRDEADIGGMRALVAETSKRPDLGQELVFYAELAETKAIAPRVQAVGLQVNGTLWDTAVLVEQPSAAMVTASNRPLGALVGWDVQLPDGLDVDTSEWLPQPTPARWSTGARALVGTPMETHTAWAQGQLDHLRAGDLPAEQVVDVEATARVLALAELTGLADRVFTWGQLRWYLHPTTLKLEPVVQLTPDLPGPQVRTDTLLLRLLQSKPLQTAYATRLRAEAQRLLAPSARPRLEHRLGKMWISMPENLWLPGWELVQQRAHRVQMAEKVPVETLPPPPTFLPASVTPTELAPTLTPTTQPGL